MLEENALIHVIFTTTHGLFPQAYKTPVFEFPSLQEGNGGLGLVGGGRVLELTHDGLGRGHVEGLHAVIFAGVVVGKGNEHPA